jgi:two-component system invasion response regulator UvrY
MIKLFIVDDHILIREGIKDAIDEAEDIQIVGEAASGEELLEHLESIEADMIILDLAMPGMGGKETLLELMDRKPCLPIVFFSMHHDRNMADQLMDMGAAGYITKDTDIDDILDIIRKIDCGERYISPTTSFDFDF